jgi:hypothetical protein
VAFEVNGYEYHAIEQNLDKPIRWGQCPKNNQSSLFVASGVDDDVKDYGALRREYLRHLSVDELTGPYLPSAGMATNSITNATKRTECLLQNLSEICGGHLSGLMVIHAP